MEIENTITGLLEKVGRATNKVKGKYIPKPHGFARIQGILVKVMPHKVKHLRALVGQLVITKVDDKGVVLSMHRDFKKKASIEGEGEAR